MGAYGFRLGAGLVVSVLALSSTPVTGEPAAVAGPVRPGAEPAVARSVPEPEVVCSLDDPRLGEVSGLAADGDTVYAVNDGGTRVEVFVLDRRCRVRDVLRHPTDPYDVEDMATGPDGTLWLGDTGDNRSRRDTVALHAVSRGGSVLYRLTYPDGPHDAEALLVDRAGTPYIITKSAFGGASIYRPATPPVSPGPTPLEKVGTLTFTSTDTPGGPVGGVGSVLVTGAASSADGRVVAVRTYTDAYLYPVTDGDLLAALRGEPVRVPLPHEKQGEAIAFTDDGTLLSVSEGVGSPLRAVPGAAALARTAAGAGDSGGEAGEGPNRDGAGAGAAPVDSTGEDSTGEDSTGGLDPVPGFVLAVVVAALAVLGVGRLRRR